SGSSSNLALVPNANIVFGGAGGNRTVTVTPAANQTGTATITVTVTDADNGTAFDTFVLTVNVVANTPPTIADIPAQLTNDATTSDTFVLTVNAVNDAPSFTASNPPTVNEDAGAQTVAGWATFNPGPTNESGQAVLAYTVSNVSNPALFAVAPSIGASGTLTY